MNLQQYLPIIWKIEIKEVKKFFSSKQKKDKIPTSLVYLCNIIVKAVNMIVNGVTS